MRTADGTNGCGKAVFSTYPAGAELSVLIISVFQSPSGRGAEARASVYEGSILLSIHLLNIFHGFEATLERTHS